MIDLAEHKLDNKSLKPHKKERLRLNKPIVDINKDLQLLRFSVNYSILGMILNYRIIIIPKHPCLILRHVNPCMVEYISARALVKKTWNLE